MKCPHCKKEINEDFIEVNNFRIYKWYKPVKDFPIPKEFKWLKLFLLKTTMIMYKNPDKDKQKEEDDREEEPTKV